MSMRRRGRADDAGAHDRLRILMAKPADASPPAPRQQGGASATRHALLGINDGGTILIVGDDPASRKLLQDTLALSYELVVAGSGRLALAILPEARPDLVLLDLASGGLDATALLRRLVRARDLPIPTMVIAAAGSHRAAARCLELGAVDYLVRPLDPDIVRLRVRNQMRLRNDALLWSMIELSQDAIVWTDAEGRVCLLNRAAERIFGRAAAEMLGQPVTLLVPDLFGADPCAATAGREAAPSGTGDRDLLPYARALRRDGTAFPAEIAKVRHDGPSQTLFAVTIRDMSMQQAAEAELRRLASTDPLTGALNRRSFLSAAKAELDRATRYQAPLSVAMLDIDHFKRVNDNFGHAAGDLCLAELVTTLRGELRSSDLISRYGGEEFALLLPETAGDPALALADRIRARVASKPVAAGDMRFGYTVSIGVAALEPGLTIDETLAHADSALYRAKNTGRNRVCRWTDSGFAEALERPEIGA